MDYNLLRMASLLLFGFVFAIALLYASVGFGGASGYLAVMNLFNVQAGIAASTALILNVVVAGIAFFNYTRRSHLQPRLLWPFAMASIPAAFIGGSIQLNQVTYQLLLNAVLFYLSIRLLFENHPEGQDRPRRLPPGWVALAAGAALGLLSGMLGVGGGIFLSPVILFAGWGDAKQAAASSAGFIFLNSLSGLAGRAWGGTLQFGALGMALVPFGIAGGLAGSYLGASYLSSRMVRRALGVVLLLTVVRSLLGFIF